MCLRTVHMQPSFCNSAPMYACSNKSDIRWRCTTIIRRALGLGIDSDFLIRITSSWFDLYDSKGPCTLSLELLLFFIFFRIRHAFLSKCLLRMRKHRKSNLIQFFFYDGLKFRRQCVNVIDTTGLQTATKTVAFATKNIHLRVMFLLRSPLATI